MAVTGPVSESVPDNVDLPNARGSGPNVFWGMHRGGCQFVYCDGSVHFLKETIAPSVFSALASRAGGETVNE